MTNLKKPLFVLLIIVAIVKVLLLNAYGDFHSMNKDEERNYKIAQNYVNGKGYTYNGRPSSFHGTFPVFTYIFLQKKNISKAWWIYFVHYLAIILFVASIYFLFKILILFNINSVTCILFCALYAFYPSNLYYIGNFFLYEKITLPILVIIFYYLTSIIFENKKYEVFFTFFLSFLVVLSCLYRAQLIIMYACIFFSSLIFHYRRNKTLSSTLASMIIYIIVLSVVFYLPILNKNKKLFGAYVLSTQLGYELMQGHNDLARGSWYGQWNNPESEYYKLSKKLIPGLGKLNEFEESEARKEAAISWVLDNPIKEVLLIGRKTVIFFLPKNYEGDYNVVNFLLHMMFIVSVIASLLKVSENKDERMWFLTPILSCLFLCFIFFVGFRWRSYAEPFMILYSAFFISGFVNIYSLNGNNDV